MMQMRQSKYPNKKNPRLVYGRDTHVYEAAPASFSFALPTFLFLGTLASQ